MRKIVAALVAVFLILLGSGLIAEACRGSRECREARFALDNWEKRPAHLGTLAAQTVWEDGREEHWLVGPATFPGAETSGGVRWDTSAVVRFPAQPKGVFANVYCDHGEVRSEDELLYYSKQWPLKGAFAVGLLLALCGAAAGLWALGWLERTPPLAQTPIGAFPLHRTVD